MAAADIEAFDDRGGPDIVDSPVPEEPLFSGPFFRQIGKRKAQERDAKILITADHGQTGVGKTACAVYVAKVLDTSPGGFTAEKATLNVPEFIEMWGNLPKGSAAILDEAEQLDARRSNSHQNVDASMKFQTHRVRQVMPILTLPSPAEIDSRIERLADFWINIEARGTARIYEKRIHSIKQAVYYKTLQTFSWPNMDGDPDYQALANMKDDFIDDEESDDNYVRESKVKERVEKAEKEARRETRDKIIKKLVNESDLPATTFAHGFDVSANRIRQIARGEA